MLTLQAALGAIDGLLFFSSALNRTVTSKGKMEGRKVFMKSTIRHPVLTALRLL